MRRSLFALAAATGLSAVFVPSAAHAAGTTPAVTIPPTTESVGCSWYGETDQRDVNVGAPDLDANYWLTPLTSVDGQGYTITGEYPAARYFSFTLYNTSGQPLDSIYDQQIVPDAGTANPYLAPTKGSRHLASPGTYSVHIAFADMPAEPAADTIYAGAPSNGEPGVALLTMRLYVPTDPTSQSGGVAYPVLTLDDASGDALVSYGACASEPIPEVVSDLIVTGTDEYAGSSLPDGTPTPPASGATNPPSWARQFGSALGNQQNAYLATTLSSSLGQLAVVRLRTPTFPDNRAGQPVYGAHQLRYWSMCTYDSGGNSVFGCSADYDDAISGGYTTYVVSTAADRPTNATTADGVEWLPAGPAGSTQLVYRNMLPSPSFKHAVQDVTPSTTDVASVLGAYYPEIAYCSTAAFEAGGWRACVSEAR